LHSQNLTALLSLPSRTDADPSHGEIGRAEIQPVGKCSEQVRASITGKLYQVTVRVELRA
jgi:hypothetical protein